MFVDPRLRRRLIYALLVVVGFALAIAGYYFFLKPPDRVPAPSGNRGEATFNLKPALPQHPQIQVYMNQSEASVYADPYRNIKRYGDNFEQIIVDAIKGAKRSVDVAVQEFRLPNIAKAMIEKHRQGVKVRLIIENTYNKGYSEFTPAEIAKFNEREKHKYEDFLAFADLNKDGKISREEALERDTIVMIKDARLPYIDDTADGSKGSGLMHHKFTIIDGEMVLHGSANYTMSDMHGDAGRPETVGNANNFVVVKDRAIAQYFTEEFNLMWGDGPGGQTDSLFGTKKPHRPPKDFQVGDAKVTVKFSPDPRKTDYEVTSNGLISRTLNTANSSVDMALFVFAEPYIGNMLEEKHNKGVKIRALVERGFAYREYATTLDMWGLLSTQDCRYGNQRPWGNPITTVGVHNTIRGDMLHHKFGLVDKRRVVMGSHNWSMNANYTNDETLMVIDHPTVAAHYEREFERLFANSTLGPNEKATERAPRSCDELQASTRKGPKRTRRSNRRKRNRREEADVVADQPRGTTPRVSEPNPSSSNLEEDEE